MRIIAGTAGSIPIEVPKSLTRPTTDRVREAVFSSLSRRVAEAAVLDLFAGSGSLGLEALSRGARSAVFVDSSATACAAISKNLEKTGLSGGRVVKADAVSFLSGRDLGSFDLVFADPPYARDDATLADLSALLENPRLAAAVSTDGLLVLESSARAPVPEAPLWKVEKERIYGKTRVSFLAPTS
ncbi:MAG: 16S rRNA (guanine(966)-N(2))-methyltransferase RsmD [Verrucomicrobiales bacterium]